MKKFGLFILMITWVCSVSSKSPFFTPELRQELKEYLAFANKVDQNDDLYKYFMKGIIIINLLTDCNIDEVEDDYAYGIYMCVALLSPTTSQILLKHNDEYRILNTSRPIMEALNDLDSYFKDLESNFKEHPFVFKLIRPLHLLYIGAVYRVYMENRHETWLNNISVKDKYLDILQNYKEIRPLIEAGAPIGRY